MVIKWAVGTAAHTSPKSLHGASKSLARLQDIDDTSPTIAKEGKRTHHTVQNSVKSTRSLHGHHHRVHTPPMESMSFSIRKKSKSHEHHRSGTGGGDGLPNDTKGSCRNSPANEEESGTVEELMKQVQDLKAQLKEKTETIVKMEVSLDIANDTIRALSKKIKHERHERPTHRHSAFDLYQERLKPPQE